MSGFKYYDCLFKQGAHESYTKTREKIVSLRAKQQTEVQSEVSCSFVEQKENSSEDSISFSKRRGA